MSVPVGPPPQAFPPAASMPAAKESALPTEPCEYQQLFGGPRRRWWRPLVSLLLTLGFWLIAVIVLTVGFVVYAVVAGKDLNALLAETASGALGVDAFLFNNLILIALIPAVLLANRISHGVKFGYTNSVAGRMRWGWLFRCLAFLAPLWVIYLGVAQLVAPAASPRPEQWLAFLIIMLLTTPLQCAAEEYAFRGWIMQNLGAWVRPPVIAVVLTTVLSSIAFALAHGSLDPFVLADIGLFAVAAVIVTWRTGGLEAAIAMHIVNNVLIFVSILIFGGWADALVDAETTGSPLSLGMTAVVNGIAVALILWQAKRARIDRLYRPAAPVAAGLSGPDYPPIGPSYPGQYPESAVPAAGQQPFPSAGQVQPMPPSNQPFPPADQTQPFPDQPQSAPRPPSRPAPEQPWPGPNGDPGPHPRA